MASFYELKEGIHCYCICSCRLQKLNNGAVISYCNSESKYLVLKGYGVEKAYFIYLDLCMSFLSWEIGTKINFFGVAKIKERLQGINKTKNYKILLLLK